MENENARHRILILCLLRIQWLTYVAAHLLHVAHAGEVLLLALLLLLLIWQWSCSIGFHMLHAAPCLPVSSDSVFFCQCSTTNLTRLVLLPKNSWIAWPFGQPQGSWKLSPLSSLSADLMEMSLYMSNTTSTLLLPSPSRNTQDKILSAISPNVR